MPRLYLKSDALPTELFHQMISYGLRQVLVGHSHLIVFLEDDQKDHSFSLGIYTIFRLFKTTFLTRVVCMFAQLANIRTADLAFTLSLISMIEYALQMAQFSPLRTSKMRGFFQDISVMIYYVSTSQLVCGWTLAILNTIKFEG